jgi:acid-sensing ion channel, other
MNAKINCTESFEELFTKDALCYTFNGLDMYRMTNKNTSDNEILNEEWTIDEGYSPAASVNAYPRRALGTGTKFGFSMTLRIPSSDVDMTCYPSYGFHVSIVTNFHTYLLLHNNCFFSDKTQLQLGMPTESLDFSTFVEIGMNESKTFTVIPKIMTTSDELKNYPVNKRKCVFRNERRLKYFNEYTQSNCEIECEVDQILEQCGCVPVFHKEGIYTVFFLIWDKWILCWCFWACEGCNGRYEGVKVRNMVSNEQGILGTTETGSTFLGCWSGAN